MRILYLFKYLTKITHVCTSLQFTFLFAGIQRIHTQDSQSSDKKSGKNDDNDDDADN